MKFVNLDESEIIEQPLEKVIARPDYSPIEFGYDNLCSLDSVSVDGIHPSGDDPDLILPPSINKINNCFKSEYFKISNLFSEIQTYELRKQALENLQLFDIINDLVKNSQNKLQFYKEENNTASIITNHIKDDGLGVHTDSVEVGVDNCIRLRSEEDERGHISEIKITPDKIVIDASDVYIQNKPFIQSLNEINNNLVITKGSGTNSSLQVNAPGSDASGTNSFAVGMDAVASGDYSVAMGRGCSATGRGSIALGGIISSIKLTGEQNAVTYQTDSMYVNLAKYIVGLKIVDLSDLTTPIATITATNVVNNTAFITVDKTLSESALSSKSYGLLGCNASGNSSIALAGCIRASGVDSIAEGYYTVAAGNYSHAEGYRNVSSGLASHTEGILNEASGKLSHAEGYSTIASASSAHSEGSQTAASGAQSHAEGWYTIASGNYSHTEGSGLYNIYLTGNNSTYQISYGSNIQNTFHFIKRCQGASIVEYTNYTKIAVINSINISEDGYTVTVVTDVDLGELSNYRCGVAINIASGRDSHTENTGLSSGESSHAGGLSLATKEYSFSHGYQCTADGEVSTSFGINTYSQNNSEFALGRSNHSHTGETLAEQTLFSVGCGDFEEIDMSKRIEQQLPLPTPEDGTNALEIMLNGDIWLGGYEEGVKLFEGETKELNTYTKEELDIELDSKIESEPVNTSITNIEESLVSSALRKTPLTLTESEKEQARTNIEALKELTLTVKDNGNIVISNIQGETKEFMPATPSGDPMHYAYGIAGAQYNATDDFIIKDAPWKDMVDTIEDKAKWGFDVVDASQVKQITIGGTTYNYVQTTRTSPGGITEPRYFLVGQASNGTWVEDETKVLHLPGHWYLNGLGDITGKEILPIYRHYNIVKELATFRVFQITKLRTFFPLKSSWYSQYNSSPVQAFYYATTIEAVYILSDVPLYNTSYPVDRAPLINDKYGFNNAHALRYVPQHRVNITNELTYKSSTKLHVVPVVASTVSLCFNDLIQISKNSILYIINNAIPTTAITITLHADRYSQLSEDADIVAALETKNAALAGTGGSISLVSA